MSGAGGTSEVDGSGENGEKASAFVGYWSDVRCADGNGGALGMTADGKTGAKEEGGAVGRGSGRELAFSGWPFGTAGNG